MDLDIHELIDANEASHFINIGANVIRKFEKSFGTLHLDEFVLAFISNLKESNKNNHEYIKLLTAIDKKKNNIENTAVYVKFCWELKKFGAMSPEFAKHAIDKSINNKKISKYLSVISGEVINLSEIKEAEEETLAVTVYLMTRQPAVNHDYLESNLSEILQLIEGITVPGVLI